MPLPIEQRRVPVVNPQGQIVTIPEAQLAQAMDFGYKPTTSAALGKAEEAAQISKDYGGVTGGVAALAGGASRGFTLGASDLLWQQMGMADEARLAKEQNQGLATTGELAAIAGTLLTGTGEAQAATMLGKLGRGAALMPRTVARLGEGAAAGAEMLAGTGGGLLARAARKGLQMGAQGAVEGSIYGLGHGVSEAALGDHELTAEKLMAEMGHGALLGGGIGGGLGIAGEFAGSGLRALAGLRKPRVAPVADAATGVGGEASVGAETTMAQGAEQRIADELSVTGGGGELAVNVTPGNAAQMQHDLLLAQVRSDPARYFAKVDDVADKAANLLAPERNIVDEGLALTKPLMDGEGKRGIAKALTEGVDATNAIQESRNMLTRVRGAAEDTMMRNPGAYKPKTIKELNRLTDEVEAHLDRIAKGEWVSGPGNEAADAFIRMDQFKREVGKIAAKGKGARDSANKTPLQAMYDAEAKDLLENRSIWGDMADYQAGVNPNYSRDIGLSKAAGEMRTMTGERASYNAWADEMLNDPGKLKAVLAKAGDAESQMQIKALLSHAENRVSLLEAVQKHAPMTESQAATVARTRDAAAKVRDIIADTTDQIQSIKRVQRMEASKSTALADAASHIPVVGGAVSAVLRTDSLSIGRKTYALQKFLSAADQKLGTSVRAWADSLAGLGKNATTSAYGSAANGVAKRAIKAVVDTTRRSGGAAVRTASVGANEDYDKRRETVLQAASNPTATLDRIAAAIEPMSDVAPNVAAALSSKAITAAAFLASIAPSPPPRATITPTSDRWTPAQDDIDRWNRAFDVVDKGPAVAIDSMRRGRLIPEEVDAMRIAYPKTLERIQSVIMNHITDLDAKGKSMPYEARLQVGTLFDIPADPAQEHGTAIELQATYSTGKPMIGRKLSGSGKPLDRKRFASAADSVEEGLT